MKYYERGDEIKRTLLAHITSASNGTATSTKHGFIHVQNFYYSTIEVAISCCVNALLHTLGPWQGLYLWVCVVSGTAGVYYCCDLDCLEAPCDVQSEGCPWPET
jgi:hypothetical protein